MILVKTKIGPSKIEGIGLFADQNISKGTIIWKFVPNFDHEISVEEFNKLPALAKSKIMHHSIKDGERYVSFGDDARFFNHSNKPNTKGVEASDGYGYTVASRDIEKGEEITANYRDFDEITGIKLKNIKIKV